MQGPTLSGPHLSLDQATTSYNVKSRACLQGLAYSMTEGDEVEDLYRLLSHAKQAMPELQAVSSGAIASDYQRLRVEHVRMAPG